MGDCISVVIPIYNVEAYLEQCISSILAQSYSALEIILVDDGSTDRCGEICDAYAGQDARIIVIHQENAGLSAARNAGIDVSHGKYLYFLDSDDIIEEHTIARLVALCEQHQAEVALTGLYPFKHKIPNLQNDAVQWEVFSGQEAVRRMLQRKGFCHEAQGKLYLRTFWGSFRFPVGVKYEDYATVYDVMIRAKKVVYDRRPGYYYRIRENSITRKSIDRTDLVLLDIADAVTDRIISWVPQLERDARAMQMATYLKLLQRILSTGFDRYEEAQQRILAYVRHWSSRMLRWKEMCKTDKIKIITLCIGKRFFYIAYQCGMLKNAMRLR